MTEARDPWPQGDFPKVVTRRAPTTEEWIALRFAWRVCAHVKSNAVIFTAADRTLAVGAGQMSRVDAVKVAVMKAGAGASRIGRRSRPFCTSARPRAVAEPEPAAIGRTVAPACAESMRPRTNGALRWL